MNKNKLTFVCPCYNHENYVVGFLNSLLSQTNPNWELLILDDASSDRSVSEVQSISDPRIRLIQNTYNKGINANVSKGFSLAETELISFVASDDCLYPDYVETMLSVFNTHPEIVACYTPLKHMDIQGRPLESVTPLPVNMAESDIFAHMFLNENLLPSPGMVFKKSVLLPYLPLDAGLIQYSDYQMHFFLLFQNKIKLLQEPLVQYRVSPKGACARSPSVTLREEIETEKLMDTVVNLIGTDETSFVTYFGNHPLVSGKQISSEVIPFWLGRLALTSPIEAKQKWGLQTIMNIIASDENIDRLHQLYGFSYKEYMGYASLVKQKGNTSEQNTKKYKRKIRRLKRLCIILAIIVVILGAWLCL